MAQQYTEPGGALIALLFASQAPIVAFFTYLYVRDRHGREPIWLLIKTTLFGALLGIPVIALELGFETLTELGQDSTGAELLIYALIGIAFVEEGAKFLLLRYYSFPNDEFNEPYDGIMYSGAISLGFAALENLMYLYGFGIEIAVLRAFTAVPMHAMTAVIMGYYVGNAKFCAPEERRSELRKGLLLAVIIHGIYDYFAFARNGFLFVVLLIEMRLALRAIRTHHERMATQIPRTSL